MDKPKVFKSTMLMRRIDKFEDAARADAWKGTYPPEEWDKLEKDLEKTKSSLIRYVLEHTIHA